MPSYQNSDYYDCYTNDKITLEPRLMEYIKKKKYFQENRIDNDTLDKEFAITDNDLMKIRSYFRKDSSKKTKMYDPEKYKDFVDATDSSFPSSEFKKDHRFDRLKIKQQRNKDAKIQRHNYCIISGEYDMYRNDRPFASAYGDDFAKSSFHPRDWFQNSKDIADEEDWNDNVANRRTTQKVKPKRVSFQESNTYVHPKSTYNGYLARETSIKHDPYSIDAIIGELDSYKNKVSKRYESTGTFDFETKTTVPNNRYSNKREIETNYRSVPQMHAGGLRNMDVDTYVRFGETPSRGSKSLGYPNPVEHYFGYISPDIQDPDHVVNNRGVSSRSFNKNTARPRTVMR